MSYTIKDRDQHFHSDGSPKRILALDGGGLRGILSLRILAKIENVLKERHGGYEGFRLCHYFDLVAGTSTGAIIAAALALGMKVEDISDMYLALGERVFQKSYLRQGFFRALYDEAALIAELKKVYGETTTIGSPDLKTGLMIVMKRLDSGSPWPIGNNPRGKYFGPRPGSHAIPNRDYPLWQVVRASTAAPRYFEPEEIEILRAPDKEPVRGQFVDGGVSPFNNPSLQALMYATLDGYRVGWPMGADKILLVSVGTGLRSPAVTPTSIAAHHAVKSLLSLMDDCGALVETLLQWMSTSPSPRTTDRELADLRHDLIGGTPLFGYLRYNIELERDSLKNELGLELSVEEVEPLSAMDDPDNMPMLKKIGDLVGEKKVYERDFPTAFDLVT
jgi:uncharacterized protein